MRYVIRALVNTCYEDSCKKNATHCIWADGEQFGFYCYEHAVAKVDAMERYEQAFDYAHGLRPMRDT